MQYKICLLKSLLLQMPNSFHMNISSLFHECSLARYLEHQMRLDNLNSMVYCMESELEKFYALHNRQQIGYHLAPLIVYYSQIVDKIC